ncbi:MAG: glycosyltransferase family 2 protein [Patescibacteria group bacterium]|jgi:glycosyltransferase involved in cell wall biosynthesis
MEEKKPQYKTLSIVIPAYNEAATIEQLIDRVKKAKCFGMQKQIIVVNDCSKDKTKDVVAKIADIKLINQKVNGGKGKALKTGFEAADGDIIMIQDADLEYNPDEYEILLDPILHGTADVVYGSRFMGDHPHRVLYYWHSVGNSFITWLSNMMTNLNISDMETCYKVFKKDVLKQIVPKLTSPRFGFEPEVTARIAHLKPRVQIYEVGISYAGRTYEEGKKINWKDGFEAIYSIIKFNLFR